MSERTRERIGSLVDDSIEGNAAGSSKIKYNCFVPKNYTYIK